MSAAALRAIGKLRTLRAFHRRHLPWLRGIDELDLVCAIGYSQGMGRPLTLKQVYLLGIGSVPTVQRRLRRLSRAGYTEQRRSALDRRSVEVMLSPKLLQELGRFAELLDAVTSTALLRASPAGSRTAAAAASRSRAGTGTRYRRR